MMGRSFFLATVVTVGAGCSHTQSPAAEDPAETPAATPLLPVPTQAMLIADPFLSPDEVEKAVRQVPAQEGLARYAAAARAAGLIADVVRPGPAVESGLADPVLVAPADGGPVAIVCADPVGKRLLVIRNPSGPTWVPVAEVAGLLAGEVLILRPARRPLEPLLVAVPPSGNFDLGVFTGVGAETRSLTFLNRGTAPLRVKVIEASCSCGEAKFEPDEIPPGGWGTARLTFTMHSRPAGKLAIALRVESNDGVEGGRLFPMRAAIARGVALTPAVFDTAVLPPDSTTIPLISHLQFPEPFAAAIAPARLDPGLEWKGATMLPSGAYELRLDFHPDRASVSSQHEFDAAAVFSTGHPVYREVGLKVTGRRAPWIEARPAEVFFGTQAPGAKATRSVLVRRFDPSAPVSVVAEHPEAVRAIANGDQLSVELTVPQKPGLFQSSVTVTAGAHARRIPFVVIVSGN